MKKHKSKKPAWIDVEKSLRDVERPQLIELLKELYQLADENKDYLHARLIGGTAASLDRYKKIIFESLYPDVMDDKDNFDFDKADKAIKTYLKASNDNEGVNPWN